ncbi:MAG: PDZ domain-containing protein [Acidobacteriota bacterium]|nr:PDZ domain-containing protein [Acidobacteriota bacterium]
MNDKFRTMTALIVGLALAGAAFAADGPLIDEKRVEEIIKATAPSVVRVEVREIGIRKIATGVVIDKDGTIVTTALISPRDQKIQVTTSAGKVLPAVWKGFDTQTGIAVIQVKDAGLPPLVLGRTGDLRPGVWIGVVGLSPENTPSITQGIVSSASPEKARLNVWIVPGTSGAPVVGADGKMVGLLRGAYFDESPVAFEFREGTTVGSGYVISRGEAPSAGMALAVPIDLVVSVAGDIRKNGKVRRGWLGVSVNEADGRIEVTDVDAKSPAEQAKIKPGDVLAKLDGKALSSGAVMSQEIRSRKPWAEITLGIERDGKPLDVKVKLGEYSEADAKRELELLFPRLFPQMNPVAPDKDLKWERRKYIGVSLNEMNPELAEALGAQDGYGLLVTAMEPDGAAKKAGLKVGDIILKADGKKVTAVNDLSGLLQGKKKGDKVKIEYVRDKKTMTADVEVSEDESTEGFLFPRSPGESGLAAMKEFEAEINNLKGRNPLLGQDPRKVMRNPKAFNWI